MKIPGQQSTLRKLAVFAEQNNLNRTTSITAAWRPTDWKAVKTAWKPTMTSRFHDCLKDKRRMDRNVAFNTLLAVSTPCLGELTHWPVEKGPPRWQTSSLHKYDRVMQVVWIAKEFEHDGNVESEAKYVGIVEAHFAGSPGTSRKCLCFTLVCCMLTFSLPGCCREMPLVQAKEPYRSEECMHRQARHERSRSF
jgi:hypothetical protein